MKQAKYNSLCTILLILSAVFFTWIEPVNSNIALAQVSISASLVPAPSLQQEQPLQGLTSNTNALPPEVQSAVLEDAARQTSKNVATLKIRSAQPQNWSDGCLGLAEPDELCTQVITPGWKVVI
ncbi:MAG: hypothetical protein WBM44_19090, partial [Waterburya sp.]